MKLSRIVVKHVKDCAYKNSTRNPWSGLTDGHYWGNHAANPNGRHRYHIWHKVTCNDPDCPAIKAVHSSVLEKA